VGAQKKEAHKYGSPNFWTIGRFSQSRAHLKSCEVLVFGVESAPILIWSYASAMRLAMHCHVNRPSHDLR
jgi:hypothetical protein